MSIRHAAKMAFTTAAEIPTVSQLFKRKALRPPPPDTKIPVTVSYPEDLGPPAPSESLNDRVGLFQGDITTLAVDAIVNAANSSLMGGGGVDGAIHSAAGPNLLRECATLRGCEMGSAKITGAYDLPCRKIIHAVGPTWNTTEREHRLASCYKACLDLAVQNSCRTVAFACISTGIYGYPKEQAAQVAISTVRKYLLGGHGKAIHKVVFVMFGASDRDVYYKILP